MTSNSPTEQADIVIVGAGAAGLMAGIFAARTNPDCRVLLLDGARKLGAKILVAGGGRCNVTHDVVDVSAYAGSTPNAIKKVLRRFDVEQTIAFFREFGVKLKREETGKLFPTTDDAHTILNALLAANRDASTRIHHPCRVEAITRTERGFALDTANGIITAQRVILATGGRALPKSGSDGAGYQIAKSLGHTLTPRIFPALVPLTLPRDHFICSLSGVTVPTTLEIRTAHGKRLKAFTDSTLCTHFGLSGPSVLDISRYYQQAQIDDPNTVLTINWIPEKTSEIVDQELQALNRHSILRYLTDHMPERLARTLCHVADLDPTTKGDQLPREKRRALVETTTAYPLPITGNRGYTYAEVTAGGIPLSQLKLDTLESRVCSGLYLCGEICDVDGRIGGYNFQWAWASGHVAGSAAAQHHNLSIP